MGYETSQRVIALTRAAGRAPFWLNELGPSGVAQQLTQLLAIDRIEQLTIHRYASSLVLTESDSAPTTFCDRKTRLRFFTPNCRICPRCLGRSTDPPELLNWSLRPLPLCLRHGVLLVSLCTGCGKQIPNARSLNRRCRCGFDLAETSVITLPPDAVSRIRIVSDCLAAGRSLIPDASVAATMYWLERIGCAVERSPIWLRRTRECFGLPASLDSAVCKWIAAADILDSWPIRFFEFLETYGREPKHTRTSTGVSRAFGSLLREASMLEDLNQSGPADVLRDFLTDRYNAGHLSQKVGLFRNHGKSLNSNRNWTTQTAAASRLAVSLPTVRRLVEQTVLEGTVTEAGHRGKSVGVVSQQSVEVLEDELATACSCAAAAKLLGCDRHRVLQLVHRGILSRAVQIAGSWKIPRQSVTAIRRLIEQQRQVSQRANGWLTIRDATRCYGNSGLSYAIVIELLRSGSIEARRIGGSLYLTTLLLKDRSLVAGLPEIHRLRDESKGVPLSRLASSLFPGRPTKERTLRKWIAMGMLRATRNGRVWSVGNEEVADFHSNYCLASEACLILNRSRATLARWETQGHLSAVYGRKKGGGGFTVYLRSDIEKLAATWPVRARRENQDS